MKTSKKDIILIAAILVFALIGFLIFNQLLNNKINDIAVVKHWIDSETYDLVRVDFNKKEVTILNKQKNIPNTKEYPYIDYDKNHIYVLGEYKNPDTKLRVEVVIEYNFTNKTMQIVKEESPKNVCSKLGVSKGKPLICIPNQVKVVFESNDGDIDDVF